MVAVLALVLVAALAGVHLSGAVGLNPALRSLDAAAYVPVKQALDVAFPRLARPLLLGALLATVAACLLALADGAAGGAALLAAAVALLVVTLLAVLRGDLPINRAMAGWDPAAPPAGWATARARWERFFAVRTAATLLATGCAAAAVVLVG